MKLKNTLLLISGLIIGALVSQSMGETTPVDKPDILNIPDPSNIEVFKKHGEKLDEWLDTVLPRAPYKTINKLIDDIAVTDKLNDLAKDEIIAEIDKVTEDFKYMVIGYLKELFRGLELYKLVDKKQNEPYTNQVATIIRSLIARKPSFRETSTKIKILLKKLKKDDTDGSLMQDIKQVRYIINHLPLDEKEYQYIINVVKQYGPKLKFHSKNALKNNSKMDTNVKVLDDAKKKK